MVNKMDAVNYLANVPICAYATYGGCGGRIQRDHIVPVCRGGNDRPENLQDACATHNMDKGSLTHEEYVAKLSAEGPPGSSQRARQRPTRRGRPWDGLVAGRRPFERDALLPLLDEALERDQLGKTNARFIETIRRLPEWLVYDPDPTTWPGAMNPKNLRPARPEEVAARHDTAPTA